MTGSGTLYAGLPVVETRQLDDDDRKNLAGLRGEFREVQWTAAKWIGGYLAFSAAMYAWSPDGKLFLFRTLVFLVFLSRFKFARLLTGYVRWRKLLRADEREGSLVVCKGVARDFVDQFTAFGEAPATRLQADPDDVVTIEVLPRSRTLMRLNGRWPNELCLVVASNPSAVPQHALMAANFVRPIDETGDVHMHQRLISDPEQEELRTYVPRLPLLPILITALAAAGAVFSAVLIVYGQWVGLFPLALLSLIVGLRVPRLLKTLRFRRNVVRDLDYGYFLIVRLRQGQDLGEAHEFLPSSRLLWTIGGRVAPWRHLYAPR